uniref:Neur_chan_LBD domain-containing protein n=1 Tax=Macrostomum lignano TaxID=282301 RepID=A0A1I8FS57_9PLAT
MMQCDLPRLAKHYSVPLVMNDRVVEIMFNTGTLSTMRFLTCSAAETA